MGRNESENSVHDQEKVKDWNQNREDEDENQTSGGGATNPSSDNKKDGSKPVEDTWGKKSNRDQADSWGSKKSFPKHNNEDQGEWGNRPPRREWGNRPPRREQEGWGNRPPRNDRGNWEMQGSRPPMRRDDGGFGNRSMDRTNGQESWGGRKNDNRRSDQNEDWGRERKYDSGGRMHNDHENYRRRNPDHVFNGYEQRNNRGPRNDDQMMGGYNKPYERNYYDNEQDYNGRGRFNKRRYDDNDFEQGHYPNQGQRFNDHPPRFEQRQDFGNYRNNRNDMNEGYGYHKRYRPDDRNFERDPNHRHPEVDQDMKQGPRRNFPESGYGQRPKRSTPIDPPPSRVLGLFGLSINSTVEDLREFVSKYIPDVQYEDLHLVTHKGTGASRGFAFIYFNSLDESMTAKELLSGKFLDDREIRVDFSISDAPRPGMVRND